jgi:short-subunit dehydrogenase
MEALSQVKLVCEEKGAIVEMDAMDVSDTELLRLWIHRCDSSVPLDCVIANAGVAATVRKSHLESHNDLERILGVNACAALITAHEAASLMVGRNSGQVVFIGSVGGWVGMPVSAAYNATKAAVRVYAHGLRGQVSRKGVKVTVVMPGFVETDMSAAYPGPKPWLVSADDAADRIVKALQRNPAEISFPWPLATAMRFLSILPADWSLWLQRKFGY